MADENEEETPEEPLEGDLPETPARKWLYDRINGKSKYGDSHPPCRILWVPPPVGWCPSVLEENIFCKVWGRLGLIRPENETARFWLLRIGFVANVVGFLLTLYSCLAITDSNYDLLKAASFSSAVVTEPYVPNSTIAIALDVGLRAAALVLPNRDGPIVVSFDDFCDLPSESLTLYLDDGKDCGGCQDVSSGMVVSVVVSAITFIPSFSTDILRMYSNYDVNCQKGFSTLFATMTLILSLYTLLSYNRSCFAGFYDGDVPYDAERNIIPKDSSEEPTYVIKFDWSIGPGLICLYTGTLLKSVDILCNLLVPSPNITRDHKEQWDYETSEDKPKEEEEQAENEEGEITE
jgi:hypothetical protein